MPSSDVLLEKILEQSNRLHALILNGRLEEAREVEEERESLIKACFSPDLHFEDPKKAADSIRKIMSNDQEAMAFGQRLYTEMERDRVQLQKGKKAVSAYHDASS